MNNIRETKKFNFAPVAVALFLFFRAIMFTRTSYIGLENLHTFSFSMSNENIALIVLYVIFAALSALVIAKLGRKFGDTVSWISVLLVAEPLFFAKEDNCIALLIMVLGLVFVLNGLREKPIIPNEITLVIFLLVSCVLAENAIFTFVAPALIAYFIGGIENTLKNTKKIVMLIFSAVSIGAGILINYFLTENFSAFENFIKVYSFAENFYFKHIPYENVFLLVFLVPTAIFGGYFFAELFRNNDGKPAAAPYIITVVTACAYILSIVGFVLGGSDNLLAVNFIVPVAIISMMNSKSSDVERALRGVNAFVGKYSLVFVSALVVLCFLSVRVFYENVSNILAYVLII